MGNCHAVDSACITLEHPDGKVERLDYSSSARQFMLQHPGHYVALVRPLQISSANGSVVHLKLKQKLLPPDTMLNIGSCYRLVSFEDVLLQLSDTGKMAHQRSRKETYSNTIVFKRQHQRTQGCCKACRQSAASNVIQVACVTKEKCSSELAFTRGTSRDKILSCAGSTAILVPSATRRNMATQPSEYL